jgi:RHS repeat-associated protein
VRCSDVWGVVLVDAAQAAGTGQPGRSGGGGPQPPTVSLPKGGGAIRGIGEKFAANPVTGTGSTSVPIACSPGRSGFGPQLLLSYDSGSGNGAFGLGWSLALPSITRKTDKGLPRYDDDAESDVFILAGAEDLTPVLIRQDGQWLPERLPDRTVAGVRYRVRRYRPRTEGLFARIERWTNLTDRTEVFWRSISHDDITTWYGRSAESRIADPADPSRVFSWLICASYDDRGNALSYRYRGEDGVNVDTGVAWERNRQRGANRYLKRILYGNHKPYLPVLDAAADWPALPADDQWYFELVFDYGEHDQLDPVPADSAGWAVRLDPFSSYRSGFELRHYRLCQRALMFHHFPDEPDVGADCLVSSTDFSYSAGPDQTNPSLPSYSLLSAVTQRGYQRQAGGGYRVGSHPPLEFGYTEAVVQDSVRELDGLSAKNLPVGLAGGYRWLDLDAEGTSGILVEQAGAWFYKRNLSPLNQVGKDGAAHLEARLGGTELVPSMPALALADDAQFLDLTGDGRLDVVRLGGPGAGYHQRAEDGRWQPFTGFRSLPNRDWADPNLRFVDLDGDGHADVLITEADALAWHPSLAEDGFGPVRREGLAWDEERGPALIMADGGQSIHLADMSGDGLVDLVRVRNGEICYWPNLGYGRFGPKVTMAGGPLDRPELFDQRRVRLADIDGSGTTDLIYLHADGIRVYFNRSGNHWAAPVTLPLPISTDALTGVLAVDLLGNGTACLVWSSTLPGDTGRPLRYLDLMGGQKPHLLVRTNNNLGLVTEIQYAASTTFYLRDKLAGTPWLTRLPFPVHVVERVTVRDKWQGTSFTSTYSYHHGYFDGEEREFRGFGRVEKVDAQDYGTFAGANVASPYVTPDHRLYQPPVKTVTWFHTGAPAPVGSAVHPLEHEYFPTWFEAARPGQQVLGTFAEHALPDPDLARQGFSADEQREALRACRGVPVRQEIYELDLSALTEGRQLPVRLFSATSRSCQIRLEQPRSTNRHAVLHVVDSEVISYHYELDLRGEMLTPDPRITHTLNLQVDEYGNVGQSVTVGYPRWQPVPLDDPLLPAGAEALVAAVQAELHVAYAETRYTTDVLDPDGYRLRLPCQLQTYDLTGVGPGAPGRYLSLDVLRGLKLSDRYPGGATPVAEIGYHELPDRGTPQKRLVEQTRTLFFDDTGSEPLPLGALEARALPYETYTLAMTDPLLSAVFGTRLTPDVLGALADQPVSGYLSGAASAQRLGEDTAGQYWCCSGIAGYQADAAQRFFLPERYTDPFGNLSLLEYDPRGLYLKASVDPLGNRVEVVAFDLRVLAPRELSDVNGNRSAVRFDVLGRPAVLALTGKDGEGDNLDGIDDATLDPDRAALVELFVTADYDPDRVRQLLRGATGRQLYYFGELVRDGVVSWAEHPPCAVSLAREQHAADSAASPVQAAFGYSDGAGAVLATKIQAEPASAGGPLRWIASGRTILNNKAKPVKQYEPYFSAPAVGHRFEEPQESGVTPVLFYDAIGRQVRTDAPDGTHTRAEFSPWQVASFDANDTVLEPDNPWFARMSASTEPAERRAALLAAAHADTPMLSLLDSIGRTAVTITHNKVDGVADKQVTFHKLDAEGKPLWVQDARGNRIVQHVSPPLPGGVVAYDDVSNLSPHGFAPCYDITGQVLFQRSLDGGDQWLLNDAVDKPLFRWDGRGFRSRTSYDPLQRPAGVFVSAGGDTGLNGAPRPIGQPPEPELLVERRVYGEAHPDPAANLRGRPYQVYDGSGVLTNTGYDFKGNLLGTERRLALDYRSTPDWTPLAELTDIGQLATAAEPLLAPGPAFVTSTRYDALNRATTVTAPDGSVYRAGFNEANLLQQVDVTLPATVATIPIVTNIDYDARGQRVRIDYGNGASSGYDYDQFSFRLIGLRTVRPAGPDSTASMLLHDPTVVQDLHYTYDAAGNIVRLADAALTSTVQAAVACDYVYDALYRLVAASGREHSGQVEFAFAPTDRGLRDYPFVGERVHPNDLQGLRGYTERYRYDPVGNLMRLSHHAGGDVDQPGETLWKRNYQYALDSNRLLGTSLPGDDDLPDYVAVPGYRVSYGYDPAGNITSMAQLPMLRWDHQGRLSATAQQVVNDGAPETTYYVYDSAGRRVRKVTEKQNGALKNERIYLGGYEVYREFTAGTVSLERASLQVMDDKQRVALIETPTTPAGEPRLRYQLANALGSACGELDEAAGLISYEEYHPYGTTAFQAGRSSVEVSLKRYRYTGKERDDETGFGHHRARYYVPWLGRWLSPDPLGIGDGTNIYAYASGNPVGYRDPSGLSIEQNVLNELKDAFKQRGIAYAEEVQFFVLDQNNNRKINSATGKPLEGRSDLIWEDPETGKIQFLEGKGTANSPKTPNQTDYIPEFENGGGWEIKGTKGGNLGLSKGVRGSAKGGGFNLVHSGNLKDFIAVNLAKFKIGAGKAFRFVTVSASGERTVKFFSSAEELAKFQSARGVGGTPGQVEGKPPTSGTSTGQNKGAGGEPDPHLGTARPPTAGAPKVPGIVRFTNGLGGVFHFLNIYSAYKEIEALTQGEDLTPKGYTDYGLGGRIITDFAKLPDGFSSTAISAPGGYGAGFYEKRDGKIYKDGKLLLDVTKDGKVSSAILA